MKWQDVKSEFDPDGSLRDLYILNADVEMWQRVLDLLRSGSYSLHYTVDAEAAELPSDVRVIFRARHEANTVLGLDVDGILIYCHFFTEEQIEFDIDPRQVTDAARFDQLCLFMKWLGSGTRRSVILTPESAEQSVIIRYAPEHDTWNYKPIGAFH